MLASNYEGTLTVEHPAYVDIINPAPDACSIYRIKSRDKYSSIREIVDNCKVFEFFDEMETRENFLQEIFKRENLCTTGIGHNVAIPHGKSSQIDKVRIGLGISKEGLDFDSIDGEPVHLVLVIGSNPSRQVEYLKSLAYVMNHLKNPFLRSALTNFSFSYTKDNEDPYSRFLDIMKSQVFSK